MNALNPQPTKNRGFIALRLFLGFFLIGVAGLKLLDDSHNPLDYFGILGSGAWRLATKEIEAIFGVWLLIGGFERVLWRVAVLFFFVLTAISLYSALDGQPTCGCFGATLTISPWYTFFLDLSIVAALLYCRPVPDSHFLADVYWPILKRSLALASCSAVMVMVIMGALAWHFGSPADAISHLRGESIEVDPYVTQIGDGKSGDERSFTVTIANQGRRRIQIYGGTADCTCNATRDLPIAIPVGEVRTVQVHVVFRGGPGRFQHAYGFFVDDDLQPKAIGHYAGRVVER